MQLIAVYKQVLLLTAAVLVFSSIRAQNFNLVKDINTSQDANPYNFINDFYYPSYEYATLGSIAYYNTGNSKYVIINGNSYFVADDGIHGAELWRSDGTAAGTYLVKDITPGSNSSSLSSLTAVGSKLFFTNNAVVWESDGTASGTYPVPYITTTNNEITCLTAVGNILYFVGSMGALWKTDGTLNGTSLVVDYFSGGNFSKGYMGQLTNVNGTLFFVMGYDNTYGPELWKSDGAAAGTVLVKDIYPGKYGGGPLHLTPLGNKVYFSANNGTGEHLWVSDGTANGTMMVPNSSNITLVHDNLTPFTISNTTLYFKGATPASGLELCYYNTTGTASIGILKDINPGSNSSNPANITAVGNSIYFNASNAAGIQQLWISNGTAAGTKLLITGDTGSSFSNFINNNGTLFFSYSSSVYGNELWKSDGTATGTVLVKDIFPGRYSSNPAYTTYTTSGNCIFSTTDGTRGTELWRSNGTAGGTVLIKNINSASSAPSDPKLDDVAALNNILFFSAHEPKYETEPYISNGTSAGTKMLKDINPSGGSDPNQFTVFNGKVFFAANNGQYEAIYKTDGATPATKEICSLDKSRGIVYDIVAAAKWMYIFFNNTDSSRQELWRSDGTIAGSYRLQILPGSYRGFAATVGNVLYFVFEDAAHGTELWKATGAANSAQLIKDIYPGTGSSYPANLYAYRNKIYFGAHDISNYNFSYFYTSNGTETGTYKVKDVAANDNFQFVQARAKLFFKGYTTANGAELYTSDGTVNGTSMVKDIVPGTGSANPTSLTVMDSTVYFSAVDSNYKKSLWKTTGTVAGTTKVKDVFIVNAAYQPFIVVDDKIYFFSEDSAYRHQLWVSDGDSAGTNIINDIGLSGITLSAANHWGTNNYTGTANAVFLSGYTYTLGNELYSGISPTQKLKTGITGRQVDKPLLTFNAYLTNNPVVNEISFAVISNEQQKIRIQILDITGKVLIEDEKSISRAVNFFTYPVSNLSPGIYMVKLFAENGTSKTLKAIK